MKKEQEKHPRRGNDHEETTRNLSMARPVSDRPEDKNNYPPKPQGRRNYSFTFDEDQARADAQARAAEKTRAPELPRWVEPGSAQETPQVQPLPRPEVHSQSYQPLARPQVQQQPAPKPQPLTPLPLDQWKQEQERARREQSSRSDRVRTRQRRERATRTPTPFRLSCTLLFLLMLVGVLALYLFFPENNMILLLGLDRSLEENGWLSRSDTIMLTQVRTMQGEVNMLSIPRDLWVGIPGYGENRINTAHYFAEVYIPGTGAQSAIDTVEANFGVKIKHYVRIKLEEFPRLIDAMGGITVELAEPMGGLEAGTHKLDGTEALKFVRDRSGTDDFYRMRQQQTFIKAVIQRLLNPFTWLRMPLIVGTAMDLVDTDIPVWQWPRVGVALMRAYPDKLMTQTLTRDHVTPYITAEGANVLLPNWNMILPLVDEMFR